MNRFARVNSAGGAPGLKSCLFSVQGYVSYVCSSCSSLCLLLLHTFCQAGVNRLLLVTSPTATLTVVSRAPLLSERPLTTGRRRRGRGLVGFLKALERTTECSILPATEGPGLHKSQDWEWWVVKHTSSNRKGSSHIRNKEGNGLAAWRHAWLDDISAYGIRCRESEHNCKKKGSRKSWHTQQTGRAFPT